MLVPPAGQRVVDVDQLLGELVKLEPAVGVAIDLEPRRGERLDRAVADVEAGALQRRDGSLAQARRFERMLKPAALSSAFGIMIEDSPGS